MARTRSERITEAKADLLARLHGGQYRPGERFLSAREVAAAYGVSYQTADRLLNELRAEGMVERRAASGTYLPGGRGDEGATACTEVRFLFPSRARRQESFGARLLTGLTERLRRHGLAWQVSWSETTAVDEIPLDHFLVLWESVLALKDCRRLGRRGLVLNARPEPGLDAAHIDSVSLDDFAGGVMAAELLLRHRAPCPRGRVAVMTGPPRDPRSQARRDGFLSRISTAAEVCAGGWYTEDGRLAAAEALRHGPDGLFCVNDRLAEAVILHCRMHDLARPPLVGFDDAPVARANNLTTIAIPWNELWTDATEIIRARLAGDASAARQRTILPRPVVRLL